MFNVKCIKCGAEGSVSVMLNDMDVMACSECNDEFGRDEVREHLAEWSKALAWLDGAAAIGEAPPAAEILARTA